MEQICASDELATLSPEYPWLVAHDLDPEEDDTGDQIFYTLHDPMSHYRCQIPELVGRRIRGCFHGWMILSKRNPQDIEWCLWNPLVSKLIWLPRMILKDEDDVDDFHYCCLSSSPDDPGSVLLLIRISFIKLQRLVFIFCNRKRRKRLRRWTEMSYSQQMKNVGEFPFEDAPLLHPTCCNGNIYALCNARRPPLLIQVEITVVKEKQAVINLVPLVNLPWPHWPQIVEDYLFLKGSCTRLLCVRACLDTMDRKPCNVYLYELDTGSMVWTEIKEDLKDTVFFVSLARNYINDDLVSRSPPIVSELGGGYIHILEENGDKIFSYNIKDKTISMSSTRCLGLPIRKSISIWTIPGFRLPVKAKCKLQGDRDQTVQLVRSATPTTKTDDDDVVEQMNEASLLTVQFDVLENIMKFCVGIEYLNFRATCKLCRLAAPVHKYSLTSPWLTVLDKDRGIITFKHPTFGDNNCIKAPPELFYHHKILYSRHGWLLLYVADRRIAFFNPFTTDIRKLPVLPKRLSSAHISFSFSAPPTSPNCKVVAFSIDLPVGFNVTFHHVGGKPSWYTIPLHYRARHNNFYFPICWGNDVYTLFMGGGLQVFKEIQARGNFSRKTVVDRGPRRSRFAMYYQVKCDQHHLLVIVEEYGESVEVFKLNDCTRKWEEIDGLGRHMIYVCDTSCVCMDAKIPEMENKIYFPRLHSENGKIVFYSLETSRIAVYQGFPPISENFEQSIWLSLKIIMNPKTDKLVRRTTMVATVTAAYFLLTADYGPAPNVLDPIKNAIQSAEQRLGRAPELVEARPASALEPKLPGDSVVGAASCCLHDGGRGDSELQHGGVLGFVARVFPNFEGVVFAVPADGTRVGAFVGFRTELRIRGLRKGGRLGPSCCFIYETCHLIHGSEIGRDLKNLLEDDDLSVVLGANHRPRCIIQFISQSLQLLNLESSTRTTLESKVTCFHEGIGVCEQITSIPIPLSYTRLTSRFLVLWHLTLPIILWDDCHWIVVPATFISAASLFCIEEVGVLIEEPFPMLALDELCKLVYDNVQEALMSEKKIRDLLDTKMEDRKKSSNPNGYPTSGGAQCTWPNN
ncbi:hypothetical protein OSB04_008431 [Centaurea solstitialis]|uniref:KIB1-4 beta-propeller domain-containing protein n=1 Tax=Centaurea solstitialis TaxID=347529 RepID=A0AA38WTV7_9ASTR|nr:hypothetical protein OSB04_008431 [Centaurea solstitialis]